MSEVDEMSVIEHWLALGRGPEDETFVIWDGLTAETHRQAGYRVDGPFVPADLLTGAVEALRPLAVDPVDLVRDQWPVFVPVTRGQAEAIRNIIGGRSDA